MNLYACQLDIVWEDKPANHDRVRALLQRETIEPGSIIVLPEMFATGFSMNLNAIDDTHTREDWNFLSELALSRRSYVIGGRATRNEQQRGLNYAVVFDPDGNELGRYAKLHPFSPGKEAQHFVGGVDVEIFALPGGWKLSPFVCYDLRFPEIFRSAVKLGANLMTVIANWPVTRVDHWITLLRARAIENQCYVVGVNRCGKDPYLAYPGRSLIVDPRGNVLADAGDAESVIHATIDVNALQAYRSELPFLGDMREDFVR